MNFDDLYKVELVNKKKEKINASDALKGKLIVFYFSAHWCPPCRRFTPILAQFHAKAIAEGKPVAFIFVSSDKDEASFWDYFTTSHGDYFALPFDCPLSAELNQRYQVPGIPTMVVVKANGDVIQNEADELVNESLDISCIDAWVKQAGL